MRRFYIYPLLSSVLLSTSSSALKITLDNTYALAHSLPLPANIAALSVEFCYILDFLGDVNKPNLFTKNLLQNIESRSGAPPIIRIGGNTQDVTQFCSTCPDTLHNVFPPGQTESSSTTFNANLFRVLAENLSPKQRYIFGLNLGGNNVSIPLAEVAALQASPAKEFVVAYELGNEPEYYGSGKRANDWTVDVYAKQLVNWHSQIVTAHPDIPGFQLFALATPPSFGLNFSINGLIGLDVPQKIEKVKSLSDHAYPYSICDSTRAAEVSLPNLMNHTNTVEYFAQWMSTIDATHTKAGAKFHMGETGSVSCHGKEGVSNTLGAGIWEIDYVLHGAGIGMDGVYFHQGLPYYYSYWWPVKSGGLDPVVWPTYYALLFLADAVSGLQNTTVYEMKEYGTDSLALYAIYAKNKLQRLVVLNLDYYPSDSKDTRPCQTLDVSALFKHVTVSRLDGKGSDATSGVTWKNQSFDTGIASGESRSERVRASAVNICASEAILLEAA